LYCTAEIDVFELPIMILLVKKNEKELLLVWAPNDVPMGQTHLRLCSISILLFRLKVFSCNGLIKFLKALLQE
jgi:hypothetical protein